MIFLILTCQWQTQPFTCDAGVSPEWWLRLQCDHWFSWQLPLSRVTASQQHNECVYSNNSLKNHRGEPFVESGYFVDSVCEYEC